MSTPAPPRRRFLSAQWKNLVLANYAVPEELLLPLLPPGLELDRWEGKCYASIVGFQFLRTRVLGVGWPGFRDFPEWNLRFYVKHGHPAPTRETAKGPSAGGATRGVCFVREFVPQWTVATLARVLYNEPYRATFLSSSIIDVPDTQAAVYGVRWGGRMHTLAAAGAKPAVRPGPETIEHFFKEHSWGFGVSRRGRLTRYEVWHPEWDIYPVAWFAADVDWGVLYGPQWAVMNGRDPDSVVFAVGSEIGVFPKAR